MSASLFNADWLARLHTRARLEPLRPRVALCWGEHVIGSVLNEFGDEIGRMSLSLLDSLLYKSEHLKNGKMAACWRIGVAPAAKLSATQAMTEATATDSTTNLTAPLAAIAQALHDANLGHVRHHWRNEQLGVFSESGQRLGSVERGAVRPLGITTQAVHLHALAADGRVWVQQRALRKSNDPGQWDTLMGGMVSADDTLDSALERETWEESGLRREQLQNLKHGGAVTVRRPTADPGDGGDDQGIGYVVESIAWYRCTLPDGLEPVNQDGEVAQFKLLSQSELIEWLERDKFTLEAALILVAAIDPGAGLGDSSTDASFEAARNHFLQGLAHVNAGQLHLAEASFEAALALLPHRASTLVNLGVTRFNLGKFDAALPVLQAACRLEPRNRDAWWFRGRALLALKQPQAALDCLEQACAIDAGQALLWLHTSLAQCALTQNEAGLASLDRALALDPHNGNAWGNRGVVLRDLGRLDEAAQSFEAAIKAGADIALNTYYLGAVRAKHAPGAAPRAYVERLFDDYAQDFQGHLVHVLKYRGPQVLIGRLLEAAPRRYTRVLDVGCGSGLCGPLIRPVADHLAGLDISSGMVEVARQTGVYDSLVHADAVDYLRHPDRQQEPKLDLVLAADVLIYVGALEPLFHAVAASLQPQGQFCLTLELMPENRSRQPVDMQLLPSLRYAHSQAYVQHAATEAGFVMDAIVTAALREEQGLAQMGLYVYLSLAPSAATGVGV